MCTLWRLFEVLCYCTVVLYLLKLSSRMCTVSSKKKSDLFWPDRKSKKVWLFARMLYMLQCRVDYTKSRSMPLYLTYRSTVDCQPVPLWLWTIYLHSWHQWMSQLIHHNNLLYRVKFSHCTETLKTKIDDKAIASTTHRASYKRSNHQRSVQITSSDKSNPLFLFVQRMINFLTKGFPHQFQCDNCLYCPSFTVC